jgi:hypothetical protein
MKSIDTPSVQPLRLQNFRDPKAYTHGLFRFPGRFHPPLVTYLLSKHPEAETAGDPMAGSGTCAVESVVSGRDGIFSDIDPLSCLLTRAKTNPLEPKWLTETMEKVITKSLPFWIRGTTKAEAKREIDDMEGSTSFRAPPNVFKWFQPYVAANLARSLRNWAGTSKSQQESDAILAVFAATIRRVSRADPNTASGLEVTKVRRLALKNGLRFDLAGELRRKTSLLSNGYRQMLSLPSLGRAKVIEHDAKDWFSLCKSKNIMPQIVISSPCYLSAIEYWRRHKLEYSWLGLVEPSNLMAVKGKFLGMGSWDPDLDYTTEYVGELRTSFNEIGRNRTADAVARYFEDSACWIQEVGQVIRSSNGVAYVVAGSNTTHGIQIDTPKALAEIAVREGLQSKVVMTYQIANSYMQYKTNTQRIKSETVLRLNPA